MYDCQLRTHEEPERTNIDIDDLLAAAQQLTGSSTKKETVWLALETLVQLKRQAELRQLRGRLRWEADLEAMRRDVE